VITIYNPDAQDWSNNGLGVLIPTSCIVKEDAGGAYELELVHPITDDLRWQTLQRGYLIKAPVPERETPFIQQSAEARAESPEHVIWQVTAATGSVYSKASSGYSSWSSGATYTKGAKRNYGGKSYRWNSEIAGNATPPSAPWVKITTGSKRLKKLPQGTEVIYHEDDGSWSKITTPDGTTGYILKSSIAYKRTEPFLSAQPAYQSAVPARQIRDQVFRIYNVQINDKDQTVTAQARHISYDQLGNVVKTYSPAEASIGSALVAMSANLLNEHDFNYYTNITANITADWARKNAVEAIHDPDNGAVPKLNAQLVRDNYDIFLLENVERDRGVVIAYGKNMLGITSKVNDEAAITRIMPVGYDADGKPMLLPELCIDSQYISDYPTERAIPLDVQEAKVHAADGDDPGMTVEQAYTKMREAAQAEFDKGCDLVDLEITVDFIHLGDTVEYAQYKNLQQVFLYDTVTVKHGRLGLLYKTKVVGYEFDAILGRYIKVKLGTIKNGADLGAIAGFQLPSMGISGNKLVPGSIGSQQLKALAVLTAHIGNAVINAAKIQDAAIETAKIKDLAVQTAKMADAAITTAKIALLAVDTANIKDLAVITAKIADAAIETAKIKDLAVTRAKIGTAAIGSAQIEDLSVTRAKIALGAITTALIENGAIGTAQIADASITDGKIVELTANKINAGTLSVERLVIVGGTQSIVYTINQRNGTAQLSQMTIDGGALTQRSITADRIVAGAITANEIAAATILANNIAAGQIQAQHIAAGAVHAVHLMAGAVETPHISAGARAALQLDAQEQIKLAVGSVGNNLIRNGAPKGTEHWGAYNCTLDNYPFAGHGLPYDQFLTAYVTAWTYGGAYQENIPLVVGETYTWACYCICNRERVGQIGIVDGGDGLLSINWTAGLVRYTKTFVATAATGTFVIYGSNEDGLVLSMSVAKIVLVKGTVAPDFMYHPLDPASRFKSSRFLITDDTMTGEAAIINWIVERMTVSDSADEAAATVIIDTLAHFMRVHNIGLKSLLLDGNVSGNNNIMTKTTQTYIAVGAGDNPQAIFDALPKYLINDLTIDFSSAGVYQGFTARNIKGAKMSVVFAAGVTFLSSVNFIGCSNLFVGGNAASKAQVNPNATEGIIMLFSDCVVFLHDMRCTGRVRTSASDGTDNGVYFSEGTRFLMLNCIVERTKAYAVFVDWGCVGIIVDCVGGHIGGDYTTLANLYAGVIAYLGAVVSVGGTGIYGNAFHLGNSSAPAISGTNTPTPSPGTPTTPTTQTVKYVYEDSRYASFPESAGMGTGADNWSDNQVRGGRYSVPNPDVRYAGAWRVKLNGGAVQNCLTGLAGKTIISATLTVHCETCPVGTTTHDLYYLHGSDLPYGQGSPAAFLTNTGLDIPLTQGQDTVFNITSWLQAMVNAGTPFYGFGLPTQGLYVRMSDMCTLDIVYS
jgi:phage minor structural protein